MTTRSYISILFVLLVMCLDLVLQADQAHANFVIPPFTLTEDGVSSFSNVTVDSGGTAHIVWSHSLGGLRTRTRTPEGGLGAVRTLAPPGVPAQPAADAAGNVQFAWCDYSGGTPIARTRRLRADGTLGETVDVSPAGGWATDVQVALDPKGGATFAWELGLPGGAVVQARRMAPDGSLGPIKDISASGSTQPGLAVDDAGNAVFVWTRFNGTWTIAQARRWATDGSLGLIKDLTDTGAHAARPHMALDSAGDAHIAVTRGSALLLRRLSAEGALSPADDIREKPDDSAYNPSLAVDDSGNTQVVWEAVLGGGARLIQTRRQHADGSYGPVQNLWPWAGGSTGPYPRVEFDEGGNAQHVWLSHDDSMNVMGRMVASDGSLGQIQQLSGTTSPYEGGAASHLRIAVGSTGAPVAVWSQTLKDSQTTTVVQGAQAMTPKMDAGGGGGTESGTGGTGNGSGAAGDHVAPALSGLALRPAKLVVRRRGRVTFTLSEPAKVVLRVMRRGTGRRVGAIRTSGRAGRNSLTFRGRLRGRWLKRGRYVFVAVATDAAGNRSAARRARFRVVTRAR